LLSHFLGLFNLFIGKIATHEDAIELSAALQIIFKGQNGKFGLISHLLSSFTEHAHYSFHQTVTFSESLYSLAKFCNQSTIAHANLLFERICSTSLRLQAVEYLGVGASVAYHRQGFLSLLRNKVIRVGCLLQQRGKYQVYVWV
jgi:hypothetical protein